MPTSADQHPTTSGHVCQRTTPWPRPVLFRILCVSDVAGVEMQPSGPDALPRESYFFLFRIAVMSWGSGRKLLPSVSQSVGFFLLPATTDAVDARRVVVQARVPSLPITPSWRCAFQADWFVGWESASRVILLLMLCEFRLVKWSGLSWQPLEGFSKQSAFIRLS